MRLGYLDCNAVHIVPLRSIDPWRSRTGNEMQIQEAGVPPTISRYDGMVHGFMQMKALIPTQAIQAFTETNNALRAPSPLQKTRFPEPGPERDCPLTPLVRATTTGPEE